MPKTCERAQARWVRDKLLMTWARYPQAHVPVQPNPQAPQASGLQTAGNPASSKERPVAPSHRAAQQAEAAGPAPGLHGSHSGAASGADCW